MKSIGSSLTLKRESRKAEKFFLRISQKPKEKNIEYKKEFERPISGSLPYYKGYLII